MRGALGLDAVVAGVPALARVGRHAVQVGAVADEVVGFGERRPRLRRQPVATGRADADDHHLARPAHHGRRVGQGGGDRPRAAGRARSTAPSRGRRRPGRRCAARPSSRARRTNLVERPASATAPRTLSNVRPSLSTAAESVSARRRASSARGQGAGQHGEHLVALHQRLPQRGRRGADRGDPRDDLGGVAVREPLVHVHVGAVEERVALGEHDDVAAGVQVRGEAFRARRRRTRRSRPGSRRDGRWSRW